MLFKWFSTIIIICSMVVKVLRCAWIHFQFRNINIRFIEVDLVFAFCVLFVCIEYNSMQLVLGFIHFTHSIKWFQSTKFSVCHNLWLLQIRAIRALLFSFVNNFLCYSRSSPVTIAVATFNVLNLTLFLLLFVLGFCARKIFLARNFPFVSSAEDFYRTQNYYYCWNSQDFHSGPLRNMYPLSTYSYYISLECLCRNKKKWT